MGSQGRMSFQSENFPAVGQPASKRDGFSSEAVSIPSLGVFKQGALFTWDRENPSQVQGAGLEGL